jgi:hypothetical protein
MPSGCPPSVQYVSVVTEGTGGWLPLETPGLALAEGAADAETAIQRMTTRLRTFDTDRPTAPRTTRPPRLLLRDPGEKTAARCRLCLVIEAANNKPSGKDLALAGHHVVAIGSWIEDNTYDRFGRDRKLVTAVSKTPIGCSCACRACVRDSVPRIIRCEAEPARHRNRGGATMRLKSGNWRIVLLMLAIACAAVFWGQV